MTKTLPNWKAGIADETWKVLICARDITADRRLLQQLAHLLAPANSPAPATDEALADLVAQFSGAEIAAAVLQRIRSSVESVDRAVKAAGGAA